MNFIKKIFLLSLCGGYFFSGSSYAFLGEDLGLDLYKQIDEGFESLEKKQYEYELSGQGETEINEVLKPIFADYGITCNIGSARNIDEMLSDGNVNQIIARCGGEDGIVPAVLVERVTNALSYIKRTYTSRAQSKSQKTYEVAKIGLYSDGNIENSPFDLVSDLLEIDKIIFTQELEYEGVPYEKSADQALDDFLNEDKSYLYPEEELDEEDEMGDDTVEEGDEGNDEQEDIPDVIEILDYHNYVCAPDSIDSGLDDDILGDLLDNIEGTGGYVSNPRYWEYPGGINPLGGDIWGGPFTGGTTLTNVFSPVSDSWPCDGFFCIIIEFQKSNYGLAGGESMTIETVLKRAAKHFEKASNASPTQRKQTTNNFELYNDALPICLLAQSHSLS